MPSCCEECFALVFHTDYPRCIVTDEQRGYTFNTRTQKMPHCPLKPLPEKYNINISHDKDYDYEYGYNACINEILGDK